MITSNTQVVGISPDMTLDEFSKVLINGSGLTADDINKSYQAILDEGVSPAFCLACFWVESKFGRLGICHDFNTKSPGNTRSSYLGNGIQIQTPQGTYTKYPSWWEGFKDLAARLSARDYVYGRKGFVTIAQILPVFAPVGDNNDPAAYIQSVVDLINKWVGNERSNTMIASKPDITWIGSPNYWQGRWNEQVVAIVDHIMQGTLSSTDGWFRNPASGVSATFGVGKNGDIHQYVSLSDTHWANGPIDTPNGYDKAIPWLVDCVKNNYNPNKRTISIEHEGLTGDVMPEPQYQATLRLHKWLMSQFPFITADKKHIIGHYQINLKDKRNCPGSGFPWTRLIADLTGWSNTSNTGGVKLPDNTIQLNGHALGHGFLDYFNKYGGVKFFGLPMTEEYTNPDTGCNEQVFERYWMEFNPKETNPDWQVRGKIVGPLILAKKTA